MASVRWSGTRLRAECYGRRQKTAKIEISARAGAYRRGMKNITVS
jgi:hypothetical protein